jgi:glycosyltransferase involved in cell wall biosynthesis
VWRNGVTETAPDGFSVVIMNSNIIGPVPSSGGVDVKSDRLRVTHVIHELHPGGAEQVLVDLATAFPGAGVDLQVLSLMPTDGQAYADGLRALGVPLSTLDLPSRWDVRGLRSAVAAVAATRPDVIHTHMKHADLVGAFAARRLGVPLVSTLHLVEDAVSPLGRGKRWLAGQARQRVATRTIAVSEAVRHWYLQTFPRVPADSVVTVWNGRAAPEPVPAERRSALRRELGLPDDAVVVTNVGVMRPGKGQATALTVAERLRSRVPTTDVRLLLVGDGELRPDLERRAGERGVDVVFAGHRADVLALLQASDLLLHCSDFDALPTVLIEGLAAGLPVVAARVGGVPEIVTGRTGRLVEPGDVAGLVDALADLIGDPDARAAMGAAARARFAEQFEAGRFAERLRSLYDEVRSEAGADRAGSTP